ncbi:dihydroorotate dehydrogenase B catalytic subunit [candidate division WOR-1 bacterium RIFOXYB2_FULL_42_35]|uniref:Dihydroorotate dehydrogenase n=1 Tax=candidate division WOR-1 bacterium RIFOXYC2_FULL_41_25 TaxID=1802586 RepID=A0A1F4TPZ8_UNCSA|nr:MAG: dihydroorotate dehydrogenase B catalytic subunit [candidate division WOR-1 bacterium RIFOXYA2_FULL_41_14]OGC25180.1 MAG: dihydroorotate dehydrogenase B catalytic subunit [candidate division WOR-1 bacterium RIFOXYB2_FULL_42_35]OGC34736.1 MAG: dihydroorotate dehydrogenase B catalytic subunit [candidate division WOR-1 bacterium RIFOXYC2_FULL_41_25]OGC42564.1 MAG: dihydroorotate dehydrogenase B catalytic subunit [candidate division WOR-1 bacterium RIFOXYD2_FULL_41_8]
MDKLAIELCGIKLKNPVMVASGTFGHGEEAAKFVDLDKLGAIITKTITLEPRQGNKPPRICETASGMLNSIGLQNKGVKDFLENRLPTLAKYKTPVIVNIAGESAKEFEELTKILNKEPLVKGIEVNISCPNVSKGGMLFCFDPRATRELVATVRKATSLPVIVKLSPNVTDIALIAKEAENAGADVISLINTLWGMAIDTNTHKPKLGNITGGLSGPAIKPIAIRMVWQVAQAVKIPIIGVGGIMTGADAIEFFLAGASAVQVGTANFVDTQAPVRIVEEIKEYLDSHNISHYKELVGKVTA